MTTALEIKAFWHSLTLGNKLFSLFLAVMFGGMFGYAVWVVGTMTVEEEMGIVLKPGEMKRVVLMPGESKKFALDKDIKSVFIKQD